LKVRLEEDAVNQLSDAVKSLEALFAATVLESWADSTFDKN
jgi:hypothetical protein